MLESQSHGWTTPMIGLLILRGTQCSGGTGRTGQEGVCLYIMDTLKTGEREDINIGDRVNIESLLSGTEGRSGSR